MNAFGGLLQRERIRYLNPGLFIFAIGVLMIWVGPIMLQRKFNDYPIDEFRFYFIIGAVILLTISSILYFIGSVRRDIKSKEIWLHNQQSIYKLVLAKLLYQALQLFVFCIVILISLFFVQNEIVGTVGQILFLYCIYIYNVFSAYFLFAIIGLILIVVDMQLKLYMKRWSGLLTLLAVIIIIRVIDLYPEQFLPYWKISSQSLERILPQFTHTSPSLVFDVYILEELFSLVIFIILYVVFCKWLERVLAR